MIRSRQSIICMWTIASRSFGKIFSVMRMTRLGIQAVITSSLDLDKGKRVSAETGLHSMSGPRSGPRASKRPSLGSMASPAQIDTSPVRMVASLGRLYRRVARFNFRLRLCENSMIIQTCRKLFTPRSFVLRI